MSDVGRFVTECEILLQESRSRYWHLSLRLATAHPKSDIRNPTSSGLGCCCAGPGQADPAQQRLESGLAAQIVIGGMDFQRYHRSLPSLTSGLEPLQRALFFSQPKVNQRETT